MAETGSIRATDATAYLSPYPRRRVRRPIRLRETVATYPLEPAADNSWLATAFRAFARVAEQRSVRDALILGTGNGLDALAALEIFDPETLTVTDLTDDCVSVARENVLGHLDDDARAGIDFVASDVVSTLPADARFDFVYENLPNIPATPDVELSAGVNTGRFFDASELDVPEPFGRYLLALHWRCLQDLWQHVRPGGGVLTALGGRFPEPVGLDLHRACGYDPQLVAFDVKHQQEPGLVLPGYRDAEGRDGVEFTFYAGEAVQVVSDARRHGLDGHELRTAVAPALARLEISAHEADRLARRGEGVAHSVLMIHGGRPP